MGNQDATPNISEDIARAQLTKLTLEIAKLHDDISSMRWHKRLTVLTPLLAVVVAVGGLLFGLYQFLLQQRLQQERLFVEQKRAADAVDIEQRLRREDRIRVDVGRVLQFFNDSRQAVSSAGLALDDMRSHVWMESSLPKSTTTMPLLDERTITANLVRSIIDDADLRRNRDAAFVVVMLVRWPDYADYLHSYQDELLFITLKYSEAAAELSRKEPAAFAALRSDRAHSTYAFTKGTGSLTDADIHHFEDLAVGFGRHAVLIRDKTLQAREVARFGTSLGSSEYAHYVLERDFLRLP